MRYTIAVPELQVAAANTAMVANTGKPADIHTFESADWQDSEGNRYAICSGIFDEMIMPLPGVLMSNAETSKEALVEMGLTRIG